MRFTDPRLLGRVFFGGLAVCVTVFFAMSAIGEGGPAALGRIVFGIYVVALGAACATVVVGLLDALGLISALTMHLRRRAEERADLEASWEEGGRR